MVAILARYASRFSVRALDFTVDSSLLWVGAALAVVAAVILAFVPRLPSSGPPNGLSLASGGAEVLTPDRLNSVVFGVFAAVSLAIAVVGVAGVLAFSVSARTREFGIRLALGSEPRRLLKGVIAEGALMAAAGVLAGAAFGFVLVRLAARYFLEVKMPGPLPVAVSAFVLLTVALVASVLPAARAARVDVMQALRSE